MCPYRSVNKRLPTIRKIPDDLWDEIRLILPSEKSNKTIGHPVIPFREILDGIIYNPVPDVIDDFKNGRPLKYFKIWIRLLKVYDDLRGIRWTWQSLDSISVKASLGGI